MTNVSGFALAMGIYEESLIPPQPHEPAVEPGVVQHRTTDIC